MAAALHGRNGAVTAKVAIAARRKDRLYQWVPPFDSSSRKVLVESDNRIAEVLFAEDGRAVFAAENANGVAHVYAVYADDALRALARYDPRKCQIVELRFFGGLSVNETAEVMRLSPITIIREWNKAKAWLYQELNPEPCDGARTVAPDR